MVQACPGVGFRHPQRKLGHACIAKSNSVTMRKHLRIDGIILLNSYTIQWLGFCPFYNLLSIIQQEHAEKYQSTIYGN